MCGITGFEGNFNRKLLKKMTNLISHRGPDDSGIWFDQTNSVGLGHRRLSIIDLSSLGNQPMWDVTHTAAIVYNGETYNYCELRENLEKKGYRFKSRSDTEVVLNLYLDKGEEMLSMLNGIFAFALWDSRSQSLLVARDALGVKPLYYAQTTKGFIFASELKALLAESSLDLSLNLKAVRNYINYLWSPPPDTMIKAVKKLEIGSALRIKGGKVCKKWQYYKLPYHQDIHPYSVNEAIEQVQFNLKRAVKRQMVSDVEVGAFLSGGLDSSSIVSMARHLSGHKRLQCFTIDFPDNTLSKKGFIEDLPYAQKVAKLYDVDLHTIHVDDTKITEDLLIKGIYHLDEPQGDTTPFNVYFISQMARQFGIKVLLSGTGGDDILGGYRRHYALTVERYWAWMPKKIRNQIKNITHLIPEKNSFGRRISRAFRNADLNQNERIAGYFHWLDRDIEFQLYASEIQNYYKKLPFSQPLMESINCLPSSVHPLNRMLYLETKHFLSDHNLNFTDKMSMAFGVEVRVPLLDLDLINLATKLPIRYKQNGRTGKWIFKKAMEAYLPKEIIYRSKTGFGAPPDIWINNQLKYMVEELLSERSINQRGIFSYSGVSQLLQLNRRGRIDAGYIIFALIFIEIWCRLFLDRSIEG